MQISAIFRVLGILLMVFSLSMLPPAVVAQFYQDGGLLSFLLAFIVTLATGFLLWLPCRHSKQDLKTRDGFLIVVLFWTVLSLFGALPFAIPGYAHVSITDAIFEATSGLTTTGTNVIAGIDHLPHALRYYRQQMEFLGGMGIIVLAVAILPMLGIGGMQLYRAEMPGPMKDQRLAPRLTETAKRIWIIYVGLAVLCALAYWLAGMTPFDAIGESFSTVSTGGFSVHDASFAYYHSATIEFIAVVFMILGGTNFGLHYLALQRKRLRYYWRDPEFRAYLYMLLIVLVIVTSALLWHHTYKSPLTAFRNALFTVVSLGTTTGLTSANFSKWPDFVPYLIMFTALIGGCAASTSGGIKVIRMLLLQKQGLRELKRLVHPRAVLAVRLGGQTLPESVTQTIWGFVVVFFVLFSLILLLLLATGLDFTTAFGATVSCLSNCGASIGNVAQSFDAVSNAGKWILIFAMLAGRLEVFSLLVLFMPAFWRK